MDDLSYYSYSYSFYSDDEDDRGAAGVRGRRAGGGAGGGAGAGAGAGGGAGAGAGAGGGAGTSKGWQSSGRLAPGPDIIKRKRMEIDAAALRARRNSISSLVGAADAAGASYTTESLYELFPSNYKQLAQLGGVRGIADGLGTDTGVGLAPASVAGQTERFGPNRLPEPPTKTFLDLMIATLNDYVLLLLIAAAIVSLLLGIFVHEEESDSGESEPPGWIEGVAILIAVTIVVLVTAINDYKREAQFRKLNKIKEAKDVTVIRANSTSPQSISVYDLVVGDLLVLGTGDVVPVDGLYIRGNSCATDESGQTGEPDEVHKSSESPFLLSGSKIKEGDAVMLVTCVGEESHNGKAVMALRVPPEDTPLQNQLAYLARLIGEAGMAISVLLFVILVVKYFVVKVNDNEHIKTATTLERMTLYVTTGVTIAVVAVPEGLPLAVTIALAFAMLKMLSEKNLVRTLAACETMGRATVIASDKTGTLTANKMTVVDGVIGTDSLHGIDNASSGDLASMARAWRGAQGSVHSSLLHAFVENISLNSGAKEVTNNDGAVEWTGSTTEMALLNLSRSLVDAAGSAADGLSDYASMRKSADNGSGSLRKIATFPFSSARKRSSYVVAREGFGYRMYVKGASERVLSACTSYMDNDGSVHELSVARRGELEAKIASMASDALRTLCLAHKDYEVMPDDAFAEEDIAGLTLDAITGIHDVIRTQVPNAVRDVQHAGVRVIMVTGDNLTTARAIGEKCNIYDPESDTALEGPDFAKTTNSELKHILPNLSVLARAAPLDKQRLVDRMQSDFGEVVAVTGDGTNDAPALSKADVGFGMGITGTDVAKEAADIILLDDNFASIVVGLKWGRAVYSAIRKFLVFQLTVNIVAVSLAFVGAVVDDEGKSPLKGTWLLYINLIMDSIGALALATDPPTRALLSVMPTRNTDAIISPTMWRHILGQAGYQLIVTFWMLFDGHNAFDLTKDSTYHHTFLLNVFVWMLLVNQANCLLLGKPTGSAWKGLFHNKLFIIIWICEMVGMIVLIEAGGDFASTTGQDFSHWLVSIAFGLGSLPLHQLLLLIPIKDPEQVRPNVNATRLKGHVFDFDRDDDE